MAKKPTITTITSGFASINTLNANFSALREAFDNTLSRDGSTPNTMSVDFDMNSKDIINVNSIKDATGTDVLASLRSTIDEFSDLYLGSFSSDPTVDNDGDPLVTGAIYFNTTNNALKVYNGATWGTGVVSATVSGDENTVQGENSWSASVNTLLADGNTGYGYGVFANVDTASNNVAVGAYALENLTTAFANVAVGYRALENTTVGGNNVGIGRYALQNVGDSAGTGSFNIGIGEEALQNLTSGGNNIALGYQAGHDATTGDNNFFAGNFAGEHVNADDNIAIGKQALEGISGGTSTGGDNIALGNKAIQSITTGSGNIGLGFEALKDANTGFQNIALGYQSGQNITTGQRNIFIGYQTGGEILTSSKGIIIGGFDGFNLDFRQPDMRSTDGRIVISDQDGNVRLSIKEDGKIGMGDAHFADTLLELGGDNSTVAIGEATNILRLTDMDDTVLSNQIMGRIEFASQDGGGAAGPKASIQAAATDSTPSAKLIFSTSDGALAAPEARFVIDDLGRVLVGTDNTAGGVGSLNSFTYATEMFQVQGTGDSTAGIVIGRSSVDANGPNLTFYKTRAEESGLESSVAGADVDDNDVLGNINFKGRTNAGATIGAKISAELDGTVGTGSAPAALTFHTMEDSTTSLVERIRITNDGKIGINNDNPTAPFHIKVGDSADNLTGGFLIEGSEDSNPSQPDLVLYRNSPSPADNDSIGGLWYYGNNSDVAATLLGGVLMSMTDVTAGTEDSAMLLYTHENGSLHESVRIAGTSVRVLGDSTGIQYPTLGLIRSDSTTAINDILGIVGFGHTDGTPDFPDQTGLQLPASIQAKAAETTGSTDDGARLEFYTKAVNDDKAVASTLRWTIEANGDLTSEGGDLYISSNTIHDIATIDNSAASMTITSTSNEKLILSGSNDPYIRWQEDTTDKAYIEWNSGGFLNFVNQEGGLFRFYGTSTSADLVLTRGDSGVTSGEDLGSINFGHVDGAIDFPTQTVAQHPARIVAEATETAGDGDDGARLRFFTKATNANKDTDSIERMRIDQNGTTTFYGTVTLGSNIINDVEDIYLRDRLYHDADTNTYMQFHAADQWRVVVGGSERLEVKNSSPHVLVSGDLQVTGSITGSGGGLVNAWATMEATGTVSIRADSGFTSIVDLAVGQFYANITAQSDTNYATVYGSNTHDGTTWRQHARPVLYTQGATDRNPTTTRFYWHMIAYSALGYRDVDYMMFHIAR
jgi:hypothetical protein